MLQSMGLQRVGHSVVSDSFATLWTVPHQSSLSMGFSWHKYYSELPFPSPGYLPNPEIKPVNTKGNQS